MHQFGDVEHGEVVGAEADSLVRCSGEPARTKYSEDLPPVVRDDIARERVVDELVRDVERLLVPYLGKHALLDRGVAVQTLPGLLLRHRQESPGEGVLVHVAPDRGYSLVLQLIEHAIDLVQRGVDRGATLVV